MMLKSALESSRTTLAANYNVLQSSRKITLDLRNTRAAGGKIATVFGADGFLGTHVTNRLARLGAQVIIPFRGEEKVYDHLKPMGEVGQIIPLRFSIRDDESIEKAVARSDIVVNALGKRYDTRNFKLDEVHLEVTKKIAKAVKKYDIDRFVQISTVGARLDSPSKWAKTKAESENVVKEILPESTIIRCTTVYGATDRFVNKWGYVSRYYPFMPLITDPNTKIQPLFVRDFASAFVAILGEDASYGRTYELGGSEIFTWEQFLKKILQLTKRPDKQIIHIPQNIALFAARFLEQARRPIFLKDEVVYYAGDEIVAPGSYNFGNLGIKTTPFDEAALNILRGYRPAALLND